MAYNLNRTGDNVSDLLTQVEQKTVYSDATQSTHGLLSAADKTKLDALPDVVYGTTSYWNTQTTYVPPQGKVVVYSDHDSEVVEGRTVYIPAIKIGTGLALLSELPFVGDDVINRLINDEGNITSLQIDAEGIHGDIRDANDNIASLDLRADALEVDMGNAQGDITSLELRAGDLEVDMRNAKGDIHTLTVTTDTLSSDMYDSNGRVSTLSQTVDGINATVGEQGQSIAGLSVRTGEVELYAQETHDLAGTKRRVFVSEPYAPYEQGDLWVKDVSAGGTNTTELYKCLITRAKTSNVFPYNSQINYDTDWGKADGYGYIVNKSNLEVLSNAIAGTSTQITYNADGTINSQSTGEIIAAAGQVRLQVANGAIDTAVGPNGKITTPLLGTGIDIVNGDITLVANHIALKNQSDQTALQLITVGSGSSARVLIDTGSLNVNGIFSTSAWSSQETALHGYSDTAAGTAYTNAVSQAATNATTYITNNVVPSITAAQTTADNAARDAGTAQTAVNGMSYLADALLNGTTAIGGGLVLSSLVGVGGNTGTGNAWELWGGIRGLSSGETNTGIAAWYGGDALDCMTINGWNSMSSTQKQQAWSTNRYARSLFRHDGSGYLASGEIAWDQFGGIVLHGVGIEAPAISGGSIDSTTTVTDGTTYFSIADLIELKSWFVKDTWTDAGGTPHIVLKLVGSGTAGTIEGFMVNGFMVSTGDQIIESGTPGGGSGGVSNLHELNDVYHDSTDVKRYTSGNVQTDDVLAFDAVKGWYALQLGTNLSITSGVLNAAGGGSPGASNLYELGDVYTVNDSIVRADDSAKQNGDVLTYNSTKNKWLAAAPSGGGSTYSVVTSSTDGLAPAMGSAAAAMISNHANEWVLTTTSGGTPTWRQLPANAFLNNTYSFSNADATLSWGSRTKIATTGGTDIYVTMPANPNSNTTYKFTIGSTTRGDSTNGVDLGTLKSESAAASGTTLSLVTTGEKATWNAKTSLTIGTTASTAAAGNHTHGLSIATSTGTNALTLAASTKYVLTAGGSTFIFTTPADTNTWRPIGSGASDCAAGNHTHSTTITGSSATNQLNMAFGTKYAITAGGTSYVFTTPSYSAATVTTSGLMSAADKTKLNGIATGATANTGTVTSVTIAAGTGISVDNSAAITTSGTRTITNTGVRAVSISGNYLRVNTNGTNADLTIPYATYAASAGSASSASSATNATNASYVTTTADTSNTLYIVGVTSSATTTLKRDTSITIAGGALSAGSISTSGDQTISSDASKKTNWRELSYGVNDIANCTAGRFDWIDGHGTTIGTKAQDWLPLTPELVHGEEGNYTVAYGQIALVNTVLLARKIRELESEIEQLKKK